jgi:hypothetical protein
MRALRAVSIKRHIFAFYFFYFIFLVKFSRLLNIILYLFTLYILVIKDIFRYQKFFHVVQVIPTRRLFLIHERNRLNQIDAH